MTGVTGRGRGILRPAAGGFTSKARAIAFVRLMTTLPKIAYSRTLTTLEWRPGCRTRTFSSGAVLMQYTRDR